MSACFRRCVAANVFSRREAGELWGLKGGGCVSSVWPRSLTALKTFLIKSVCELSAFPGVYNGIKLKKERKKKSNSDLVSFDSPLM